jgi:hypothetical protein
MRSGGRWRDRDADDGYIRVARSRHGEIYTRRASRTKMATESMHLLANRQNAERTNVSHFDASKKSGEKK